MASPSPSQPLDVNAFKAEHDHLHRFPPSPMSPPPKAEQEPAEPVEATPLPPTKKLCVRHQRMADEGTNLKLQQALDALPLDERKAVNAVWSNFSSSSHGRRALILQGLLTMCCFSQLSLLTEQLGNLIRIDPCSVLPREVSLRVFRHLDATSLCRAAQVSRLWRTLADDDVLWRGICEQHIGQKCTTCGWGLPILERRRTAVRAASFPPCPAPGNAQASSSTTGTKRELPDCGSEGPPLKRPRPLAASSLAPFTASHAHTPSPLGADGTRAPSPPNPLIIPGSPRPPTSPAATRPWKDVYCERLTIERNWRRGRCTVRTLRGHTDGVMCLQFSETLAHPAFPILMTGSYDRTVRIWNLETGAEVRVLRGHTRAVRALQFDACKLVTGSMDHTLKVWDWRTGRCIRTLEGHAEGVVCLQFDADVLASGSVDATVKIWNLHTGERFTLRGHRDWVNAVQLWDAGVGAGSPASGAGAGPADPAGAAVGAGKMLFSASDDGTVRLWDLAQRSCVKQFKGHVSPVQALKLLFVDDNACVGEPAEAGDPPMPRNLLQAAATDPAEPEHATETRAPKKPVLITGSLDNTVKVWDIETGQATKTLFGHIEGVWAVASDQLRLVTGSHDRTIKVWAREEGRYSATLVGHRGPVTCLALAEDKIVSGSDDGDIKIWDFTGQPP